VQLETLCRASPPIRQKEEHLAKTAKCVRERLQSCRNWPILIAALAPAELQIAENKKNAGAKEAAEKLGISDGNGRESPSAAKADIDSDGFVLGLKPQPPSDGSFSAACKARGHFAAFAARLKSCPDTKPRHIDRWREMPEQD